MGELKREEIHSLYVLKAVCAFWVVAAHAPLGAIQTPLRDIAVSCFFMITGYFLYHLDPSKVLERSLKAFKKVLFLLPFFTLVYYLVDPVDLVNLDLPILLRWTFVSIPNKYGGPLWYLTSLLWGLPVFGLLVRWSKGRAVAWLPILIVFGVMIGRYRFFYSNAAASSFVFNFVSYALPCLAMGYLAKKHEEIIRQLRWVDGSVALSLGLIIEGFVIQTLSGGLATVGPHLLTLPVAFAWLNMALTNKTFGQGSILEMIGRRYSGEIYYWHMIFVFLFDSIVRLSGDILEYSNYGALYVFILSWMFAAVIVKVKERVGITI